MIDSDRASPSIGRSDAIFEILFRLPQGLARHQAGPAASRSRALSRIFCWPDAEIDFESKAKALGEMRGRQHHRRSAALAGLARVAGIPARAVVIGYVAFKSGRLSLAAAPNAQRHISAGATLRIRFLTREIRSRQRRMTPSVTRSKLAIRCPFVDRFVGSSVPSRVSGQRFSTHDASLPSVGSR